MHIIGNEVESEVEVSTTASVSVTPCLNIDDEFLAKLLVATIDAISQSDPERVTQFILNRIDIDSIEAD